MSEDEKLPAIITPTKTLEDDMSEDDMLPTYVPSTSKAATLNLSKSSDEETLATEGPEGQRTKWYCNIPGIKFPKEFPTESPGKYNYEEFFKQFKDNSSVETNSLVKIICCVCNKTIKITQQIANCIACLQTCHKQC